MRRVTLFAVMTAGLLCLLSFSAQAQAQERSLAGTWTKPVQFEGKTVTMYMRFDPDGRFWQWSPRSEESSKGTYSATGNKLNMVYADGEKVYSHCFLPHPNILIMQLRSSQFKWTRVSEVVPDPPEEIPAGEDPAFRRKQQQAAVCREGMRAWNNARTRRQAMAALAPWAGCGKLETVTIRFDDHLNTSDDGKFITTQRNRVNLTFTGYRIEVNLSAPANVPPVIVWIPIRRADLDAVPSKYIIKINAPPGRAVYDPGNGADGNSPIGGSQAEGRLRDWLDLMYATKGMR